MLKLVVVTKAHSGRHGWVRVAFHQDQMALNGWFDKWSRGGRILKEGMGEALGALRENGGMDIVFSSCPDAHALVGRRCFATIAASSDTLNPGSRLISLVN